MSGSPSPEEFRDYLELLRKLLRLRSGQSEAIAEELRSHLESRFAQLTQHGVEPKEAISTALAEFGDAASLAAELSAVSRLRLRRRVMRFTTGSLIVTALAAIAIVSFWPDGNGQSQRPQAGAQSPAGVVSEIEADANEATWKILEEPMDVEVIDGTLADFIDFVASEKSLQFYIDRRTLEENGLDPMEVPVNIRLKNVPVEMVLRLVLQQTDLTYTLDHGVVIITSEEEASRSYSLHVRVYQVGDLVEKSQPRKQKTPSGAPKGADGGSGFGGGGLGGGGARIHPGAPPAAFGPPYDVESLANVIRECISPDSWEETGDGNGTIREFRGAFVIAQTVQNHRKIERFLQELRSAIGRQETTTQ